jgi:hypothetical protein
VCSSCKATNTECVYETVENESRLKALKRKNQELSESPSKWERLFDFLKSQPDDVAKETLHRIRRGASPRGLLNATENKGLIYRPPSPHSTDRSFLPPTLSFLEYELVVSHSNAYPSLIPLEVAAVDLKLLGLTSSGIVSTKKGRQGGHSDTLSQNGSNPIPASKRVTKVESLYGLTINPNLIRSGRSEHMRNYVDDRLARFEINRWTRVPVTNQFDASAISLYFTTDHAFLGFFDTDLFLNDLVDSRDRFCSSLLVNALLAWSCQGYTHFEPAAASFSYHFLTEAFRSWEEARTNDHLASVAALLLISLACNNFGEDKKGEEFVYESYKMAKRLHLYDCDDLPADIDDPLNMEDYDVRAAAAAAAWGSFDWQMKVLS